jgi:cob(I)alamin adenosyltransferase
MVSLTRIYTRSGDNGSSGLVTGERRAKNDLRFEAIGTVDETNSSLGLVRLHTRGVMDEALMRIQNDLFDLGADLATPESDEPPAWEPLRIIPAQVERLEREIDVLNSELLPLTSFILPGGSPAAANLHLARTLCRRAERQVVALKAQEPVSAAVLHYLNRLSDYLFVAARYENNKGAADILWVPGKNR